MTEQRLAVILLAVVVGISLAGCECNRAQFPGLYDNFSGADWRKTMQDCRDYYDTASSTWHSSIREELSVFNSNVSGDDWQKTMKDCKTAYDTAWSTWRSDIQEELSVFEGNVSGDDWRQNVAGSCGESSGSRTQVKAK